MCVLTDWPICWLRVVRCQHHHDRWQVANVDVLMCCRRIIQAASMLSAAPARVLHAALLAGGALVHLEAGNALSVADSLGAEGLVRWTQPNAILQEEHISIALQSVRMLALVAMTVVGLVGLLLPWKPLQLVH